MKQAVSRQRVWQRRNPLRTRAHKLVKGLIKSGKIQRGHCWCGKAGESHHEDYSKPLEITWLCPKHHRVRHAEINAKHDAREGFKGLVFKWRMKRKLTQTAAAAALGVPHRTFQDWEYGRRAPKGLARELIIQRLSRRAAKTN